MKTGMAASLWLIATPFLVGTSLAQDALRVPYSGVRCPDPERLKQYIAYIQGGLDPEHAVAKVTACRLGEIELKLDMKLVDTVTDVNGTYQIYSAVLTITYDPVTRNTNTLSV